MPDDDSTLTYQTLQKSRVPIYSILGFIIRTHKKVGFGRLRYLDGRNPPWVVVVLLAAFGKWLRTASCLLPEHSASHAFSGNVGPRDSTKAPCGCREVLGFRLVVYGSCFRNK